MKKLIIISLLIVQLLVLSSCKDSSVEANALELSIPHDGQVAELELIAETQEIGIDAMSITNQDSSIHFSIPAFSVPVGSIDVLQASAVQITTDFAKKAAEAVFGENTVYEYSAQMTKAQLKQIIESMEYGITDEAIRDSYGDYLSEAEYANVKAGRQRLLDYYRQSYEYASDGDDGLANCEWHFYSLNHYILPSYDGSDPYYTQVPFGISATLRGIVEMDYLPYQYSAHNLERADFYDHSISVYIDAPIPQSSEEDMLGLYSPEEPSNEELAKAIEKAMKMCVGLDLGVWDVVASSRQQYRETPSYYIQVQCRRIHNSNINLINFNSKDGAVCAEAMTICFSNDGRLIRMMLSNPLDVQSKIGSVDVPDANTIVSLLSTALADMRLNNEITSSADYSIERVEVGYAQRSIEGTIVLRPSLVLSGKETEYTNVDGKQYPIIWRDVQLALDLETGELIEYNSQ